MKAFSIIVRTLVSAVFFLLLHSLISLNSCLVMPCLVVFCFLWSVCARALCPAELWTALFSCLSQGPWFGWSLVVSFCLALTFALGCTLWPICPFQTASPALTFAWTWPCLQPPPPQYSVAYWLFLCFLIFYKVSVELTCSYGPQYSTVTFRTLYFAIKIACILFFTFPARTQ